MSETSYETEQATRAPESKTPWWVRAVGGRWYEDGTTRTPWGELSTNRCGLALRIGGYETAHLNIALVLAQAFIRLPFLDRAICTGENSMEHPSYGFNWALGGPSDHPCLSLDWGNRRAHFDMPWQNRYLFREFLAVDGSWWPADSRARSWAPGEGVDPLPVELPYHYLLNSGEVQRVTATVVRERYWKVWKWFGESTNPQAALRGVRRRDAYVSDFLRSLQKRLFRPIDLIDVEFSDEVGERAGSWKGGCTGCGWDMKPGESTRQALIRMQRERRFR